MAAVSVKRSTGLRKRLSKTLNGYQCLTLINVHAPTWLVLFLCVFISFKREQISANKYSNTYWNLHHGSSVLHWWKNERTLTHHHSTWAPWILLNNTYIINGCGTKMKSNSSRYFCTLFHSVLGWTRLYFFATA